MDHHHPHNRDLAEANKEYFSAHVTEFDKPHNIELARRTANVFRKHYSFDEEKTVVMDFACGVGLISRELAPYAKSIVGVDITQALVDIYNRRVADQGIAPDEMRAVCVQLKGEEGELDGLKFDVIVCSASYHHFQSIEDITKLLAFFLKPGGSLLVADIMHPDEALAGTSEDAKPKGDVIPERFHHIVSHTRGFKSEQFRRVFEDVGLEAFTFDKAMTANWQGQDITFFVAKGEKPNAQ